MTRNMGHGRIGWLLFVCLAVVSTGGVVVASPEANPAETTETASSTDQESQTTSNETVKPDKPPPEEEPAFLAAEPATWGSYYDPKGQFCGQYDCYSIFGFDYEGGSPDEKEIIKRYRRLGRKWHPDKSKHPQAKERFVVSILPFLEWIV